ncbi:MAG: molybdenum cofactor biosynthesis protein MoaE [Gemmatimonadota bacterium]
MDASGETEGVAVARVCEEAIDGAELLAAVGSTADGAALLFEGRVREVNDGRPVTRLHYEAYREMAEAVLREIGSEAIARFPIGRVAAAHRVGTLGLGDVSVAVAVAAPHRGECYTASRYIIEEIKRRLPVWKKETYANGSDRWLEGGKAGPPRTYPEASSG